MSTLTIMGHVKVPSPVRVGVGSLGAWGISLGMAVALAGCTAVPKPDFASPEPGARNAAIVDAAARGDASARVQLVQMLESDDPATRLLAISTLQRLTNQTFGYDYAQPEVKRRPAVVRWAAWAREQAPAPAKGG